MAVFISVTTSAFNEATLVREDPKLLNIRRPMRGIEIKEDTYCIMKVIDSQGNAIPIVNSSSSQREGERTGISDHYANFIITNVTEQRAERQQIVETFGEDYIFFFGESPRMLNFQGLLLNTNDFNWKSEWWHNYENIFRGTKLLEASARMYIYFDDVVAEGYMMNSQTVGTSADPYKQLLQFQFFVTNYSILSDVGSVYKPLRTRQGVSSNAQPSKPGEGGVGPKVSQNASLPAATTAGSGGGLSGFLAAAAEYKNDATFSIQKTLETIKNTFYGRQIRFPTEGIGNQIVTKPVTNQAFLPGHTGDPYPYHSNEDEYVERDPGSARYDKQELDRVRKHLELQSPEALEQEARRQLTEMGIDVTAPSTNYLLLGRAGFAGLQVFGSFGIRQADGVLEPATQGLNTIL